MTPAYRQPTKFASAVVLDKREVFLALESCAGAERALLQSGRPAEAAGVAALFELLEDRIVLDPPAAEAPAGCDEDELPAYFPSPGWSGWNSNDRELTQ